MPRFTTISPTHISGQKRATWELFKLGEYIAIGWLGDLDLTGWTDEQICAELDSRREPSWIDGQRDLTRFVNDLKVGDIIAVTNTNSSILGVGMIRTGYFHKQPGHETGDANDWYSHFRGVRWLSTLEWKRKDLIKKGETSWKPRGTLGKIFDQVPAYIWRALDSEVVSTLANELGDEAGEYNEKSGQGFQTSPEKRLAVEKYSMEMAKSHYETFLYQVCVVGKPYDLACQRDGAELLVEVKGTTTQGDFILLTRNEVNLAKKRDMELFVVFNIQLIQDETGAWTCYGGNSRVIQPWIAESERLEPYAYIYRLI